MKIFAKRSAGNGNSSSMSAANSNSAATSNRKNPNKDKVIDSSAGSSKLHAENQAILKSSDEETTNTGHERGEANNDVKLANGDPLAQPEVDLINKKLPRELLIRVFSNLDVVDLCRCAQVSKVIKESLKTTKTIKLIFLL